MTSIFRALLGATALVVALTPAIGRAQGTTSEGAGGGAPMSRTVGMPIPLKPNESLAPFANDCSAVADRRKPSDFAETSWLGACRFGLAHGKGAMKLKNGTLQWTEFFYGFRALFRTYYTDFKNFQSNYEYAYPSYSVHFNKASSLTSFEFGGGLYFFTYTGTDSPIVGEWFGVGRYSCPYKGLTAESIPIAARNYERDLRSLCGRRGSGSNQYPDPKYVTRTRHVFDRKLALVPGTPQSPNPVTVELNVCDYNKGEVSCTETFKRMIAPRAALIAQIMAESDPAARLAETNFSARFAPLETAFAAKAKLLAPGMRRNPAQPNSNK